MTTITEDIDLPGGVDPTAVTIRLDLWGATGPVTGYETTTGKTIAGPRHSTGNPWSITGVVGNTDIDAPTGTVYRVVRHWPGLRDPLEDFITVPAAGGPYRVDQILTDPPTSIESSALASLRQRFHTTDVAVANGFGARIQKAKAEASTRLFKIDAFGDSVGASGLGSSNQETTSVPGKFTYDLQATYGDGGTGFRSHEYAAQTGVWTGGLFGGFAATSVRATAAATLTWTGIRGTKLRIYCRNRDATGSFRYRIDGGGWTTVTPPNPFIAGEPGVIEITGLADTTHTVEIEWVSGTVFIHGIWAARSTGVIVNRFGQLGRAGSELAPMLLDRIPGVGITNGQATITAGVGSFRKEHEGKYVTSTTAGIPTDTTITTVTSATQATMSANATATATLTAEVQHNRPSLSDSAMVTANVTEIVGLELGLGRPDAVVFFCGGVDALDTSGYMDATTWRKGAAEVVRRYTDGSTRDYSPDFVYVIPNFGAGVGRFAEIASEIAAYSGAVGGACVDVWGAGGRAWKKWGDLGHWFDNVHPDDSGCAIEAGMLVDLFKRT